MDPVTIGIAVTAFLAGGIVVAVCGLMALVSIFAKR